MSITKIIKKFHSNRVQNIKNMPNGIERDLTIGSLVADFGKRSISAVCKAIGCCFRKVKNVMINLLMEYSYQSNSEAEKE